MSGLAVRPAVAADLDAVFALGRREFAAGWSRAAYGAELGRPDGIFLVVDGPGVLGYCVARVVAEEARLVDLCSAEDGKGTGRALWASLHAASKARGCSKLTFEVSARNARALAFYEKAGAKVAGRRPKFYTDGSDAVLMDLAL